MCTWVFTAAPFTTAPRWRQAQRPPTGEWTKCSVITRGTLFGNSKHGLPPASISLVCLVSCEFPTLAAARVNLDSFTPRGKRQKTAHQLIGLRYVQCPEQADLHTQNADWWLPGAGGLGVTAKWCRVSLWVHGTVLKLTSVGCTAARLCKPWALQMNITITSQKPRYLLFISVPINLWKKGKYSELIQEN